MKVSYFKIIMFILSVVICITGILATIDLIGKFSVRSQEVGSAITIGRDDENLVLKCDEGSISLTNNDDVYTFEKTYAHVDFNGDTKDYTLYLNGYIADNMQETAGTLSGTFTIDFRDTNADVVATSVLKISLTFSANETLLKVETTNENNSIAYFYTWQSLNGFVVSIYEN